MNIRRSEGGRMGRKKYVKGMKEKLEERAEDGK